MQVLLALHKLFIEVELVVVVVLVLVWKGCSQEIPKVFFGRCSAKDFFSSVVKAGGVAKHWDTDVRLSRFYICLGIEVRADYL